MLLCLITGIHLPVPYICIFVYASHVCRHARTYTWCQQDHCSGLQNASLVSALGTAAVWSFGSVRIYFSPVQLTTLHRKASKCRPPVRKQASLLLKIFPALLYTSTSSCNSLNNTGMINLLKTKRILLYIRNQSVPRRKHFPPQI